MRETWVQSLGQKDPLEKEMATHSGILAWEIPWTEEASGLRCMASKSQRRLSNWTTRKQGKPARRWWRRKASRAEGATRTKAEGHRLPSTARRLAQLAERALADARRVRGPGAAITSRTQATVRTDSESQWGGKSWQCLEQRSGMLWLRFSKDHSGRRVKQTSGARRNRYQESVATGIPNACLHAAD